MKILNEKPLTKKQLNQLKKELYNLYLVVEAAGSSKEIDEEKNELRKKLIKFFNKKNL